MSKPRLTNDDYCRAAQTLGCEVAAIKAVANQESLGSGFDSQDRPKILFERHKFHKLTRGIYDHSHPGISNGVQGGYGRGDQYVRFSEAFALNPTAAMMAASWGKFQILGSNFAICGFLTVDAFVDAMKTGEGPQLDAFCEFVLHNYLDDELTSHDWAGFARGYNGPTYRKNKYDVKIGAAYKQFAREKVDCAQIPATTAANDGTSSLPQPSNTTDRSDPVSTDTANTANADTAPDLSGDGSVIVPIATTSDNGQGTETNVSVSTSQIPAPELVEIKPKTPTWKTTIGAALTAIWGYYQLAKENFGELVDRATGGIDTRILAEIFIGLALIGLAYWLYNQGQKRAHEQTLALIKAAADPLLNTVELK